MIEAREGHRLHLHFERIALDEDDDKYVCVEEITFQCQMLQKFP